MLSRLVRPGRLVGIDVARAIALVGMIATHVLDGRTATGELTFVQELAGGRASALFAVLAGVSLALLSGGTEPFRDREPARTVLGLAARAVLIALIGLALGELETGLAIILAYYGVLFLLGLPFLALRARSLALLAAGWVVAAPAVSHLVRPELPPRSYDSPDFERLAEPGRLLADLLLTGYYPAVPWLGYLLAGIALGRIDLRGWRVPLGLAASGAGLAILATTASRMLTASVEVRQSIHPFAPLSHDELLKVLGESQHGATPTGGPWQWLLVVSPHSATPFDLAQGIGSALVVIGLALAIADVLPSPGTTALAVAGGAGAMTLTLYSLHAVMKTPTVWPTEQPDTFVWHLVVVLGIGAGFAVSGQRGPLEALVGWPGRALRRSTADSTR
ncbi:MULTISPECIES: heparan-alpha-glucosaminide N-acetyltransferase domain-containing protein [Nocardioides]|uniref:Heparan-alpha-glucosaminide N-acetyltransferase domain-containing protein n=1 Tax=Nocardioides vastitatis TaxID=2568655 RepID=A0ABW0Z9X2_9ACTN|nr:heparan-alpha-glucosaminide N-acetyltransferase domain-containing protein [Nocardioides sp.]